jgi:TolB-like protein
MTEVRGALEEVLTGFSSKPADAQPSIAVLPFANMSADAENEYFSVGLAEEIINALSHVSGLKVIARTSAFAFKGKPEDVRRIAETLGVVHVLEGSVRKAGNRIRVAAQLVAGADGSHLSSERYDRELADVFAVQDEIAAAVADALSRTLSGTRKDAGRYTRAPAAHEAHLKGLHLVRENVADVVLRTRECLERAIAIDPRYAEPHLALAEVLCSTGHRGGRPPRTVLPEARAEALQTVALDPSNLEAQALPGAISAHYDYDWADTERIWRALANHPEVTNAVYLNGRPLMIGDRSPHRRPPIHTTRPTSACRRMLKSALPARRIAGEWSLESSLDVREAQPHLAKMPIRPSIFAGRQQAADQAGKATRKAEGCRHRSRQMRETDASRSIRNPAGKRTNQFRTVPCRQLPRENEQTAA